MKFLLLDNNDIVMEFELNNSASSSENNKLLDKYEIEILKISNLSSLPLPFMFQFAKEAFIRKDKASQNLKFQSKELQERLKKLSYSLLSWIDSRQITLNREGSQKVYESYDNNLLKFINNSLCLSMDDQLWVIEADKYFKNKDLYKFETLYDLKDVQNYTNEVFKHTLGVDLNQVRAAPKLSDEETRKCCEALEKRLSLDDVDEYFESQSEAGTNALHDAYEEYKN